MEKSLAFNPAMNHWWDFGLFTLCWIKLSLFTKWAPQRCCVTGQAAVMDAAGMNYLLAILHHLPSSELSLLILNLLISIPKCTKRFLCTWNSSPLSALVGWAGWVWDANCPLGVWWQCPGMGDCLSKLVLVLHLSLVSHFKSCGMDMVVIPWLAMQGAVQRMSHWIQSGWGGKLPQAVMIKHWLKKI